MNKKRKMEIEASKTGNAKQRIVRIIDHSMLNSDECTYLCEWNNKQQTWEPDTIKRTYKPLIAAYFSKNSEQVFTEKNKKKTDYISEAFKLSRGAVRKEPVQAHHTGETKEEIKNIQAGICRFGGEDLEKFKIFIKTLEANLADTPPSQRKDYQLEYVEGVFKNRVGKVSFVVKTINHKCFVVTMENMKKHFPRTLKNYFMGLIGLHSKDFSNQLPIPQENNDHMFYYESSLEEDSAPPPAQIDAQENESVNDL